LERHTGPSAFANSRQQIPATCNAASTDRTIS
jgi:hypothetical protein